MRPYNEIRFHRTDWARFAWEVIGAAAFVVVIGLLLMLLGVS